MNSSKESTKLNIPVRPLGKYVKLSKIVRTCCRLLGVDILDINYKFNGLTLFVFLVIGVYYSFTVYTVVQNITKGWSTLLSIFPPMSAATQGLAKLISVLKYAKIYHDVNKNLENIYRKYQDIDEKYESKLFECLKQMKKVLITVGLTYMVASSIILGIPLIVFLVSGERHLVFFCLIPGVDVETDSGFLLTNSFISMCVVTATFGLYSGDLLLLIFLTHSLFFYDILVLKVENIREMVEQNPYDKRITEALNDIVEWHQFYLKYNEDCNLIFYWSIAVHVFCCTCGILTTLVVTTMTYWPSGYAYLTVSFVWLYMYCVLGTRIEICNDKFCNEVYNINWYELRVPERKTVLLMLMKTQRPRNIDIAGIMPLTVNTALGITRTIYSWYMVMLKTMS